MRTLVIGDIHGAYAALLEVLERAQVTPHDQLIFLGDYADRGKHTPQVLDKLIALQQTHQVIYLRGNHDALCCDFLLGKPMSDLWRSHGARLPKRHIGTILRRRSSHILTSFSHLRITFWMGKIASSYMQALPTEGEWHTSFFRKISTGTEHFGN